MGTGDECDSRGEHQRDFQELDASHQHGFLVLVGQLARCRRKKEERQDEQHGGDVREFAVVHARNEHTLERDQDDEALAKNVVVEGAEKLGDEKRGETALTE